MATPQLKRHNHRGSPRKCNKYHSFEASETETFNTQELGIGKATSGRGEKLKSSKSTRGRGQPNHNVVKSGAVPKKGDRYNRNHAPGDADAGPNRTGGTGGIRPSGADGPTGQGGADDDDIGDPFTLVIKGKGRGTDNDSRMWYTRSNNSRRDFARGQIWTVPYHMPNLDPRINSVAAANDNKYVKMTFARAVYSKYRDVIVLWKLHDTMIVVPFYSFNGVGIEGKTPEEQKVLMEVINSSDTAPPRGSRVNRVLRVKMNPGRELNKPSCARLGAAFSVDYKVNMVKVGDLMPDSKIHLLQTMDDLIATSKSESR